MNKNEIINEVFNILNQQILENDNPNQKKIIWVSN